MLTKELVKYRLLKGKAKPAFVDTEGKDLQLLADYMIGFYASAVSKNRGEIDTEVDLFTKGTTHPFIARGLNKLLLDTADFESRHSEDHCAWREALLLKSAELLKAGKLDELEELSKTSAAEKQLYGDLPEYDKLLSVKEIFSAELLNKYNVAQVQGILIHARSMTVSIPRKTDAAQLRRLFKYMKFFRLLADIRVEKDSYIIQIDGPLSVLDSAKKYGLQLAIFFPAICHLPEWEIRAACFLKKREIDLVLNQKSSLQSPYKNFQAYVPEEIQLFAQHFKETVDDWELVKDIPFLEGSQANEEIIFPDFTLKNRSGNFVYLELFHRWHKAALQKRIQYCLLNPDFPLIIGIDSRCMDKEIKAALELSNFPEAKYFTFRDYPTVTKVKKCLELKT